MSDSTQPAGINLQAVSAWLVANIPSAVAPFHFTLIAGGHSNLTYLVADAEGSRFVLRRPPLGHVLASAHDMGREHRVISSLQGTAVPVPVTLGYCDDPAVNDAPFYVMRYVDGHVVRDLDDAHRLLSPAARRNASESLIDTMAAIHSVDLDATGLATLGKHEGYIQRQLKRWYGQWQQQHTRELPDVDQAHELLTRLVPEQGPATIVHGDYRLDNCMVDHTGTVVAVLDWEICTLGDPLADLGLLLVYWTGPNDPVSAWTGGATTAEGKLAISLPASAANQWKIDVVLSAPGLDFARGSNTGSLMLPRQGDSVAVAMAFLPVAGNGYRIGSGVYILRATISTPAATVPGPQGGETKVLAGERVLLNRFGYLRSR